jgi:hypothetical protein
LLAEHAGLSTRDGEDSFVEALQTPEGLVARLDELTARAGARLHRHGIASEREREINEVIDPEALPFDPAKPDYDDEDDDLAHVEEQAESRPLFVGGVSALWEKLKST